MSDQGLVTLYEAGTLIEATLLRDRLRSEGVQAHLANVNTAFGNLTAGQQSVQVQISEGDLTQAQTILDQFLAENPADDYDWPDEQDSSDPD